MSQFDNFRVGQDYDIIVIGAQGSGKSSFILHYIHNRFIEQTDTEGEDIYTKAIRNGSNYNEVSILDCNSQLDFYSSSRKRQLMNNAGMIFTYAINDNSSFQQVEDLYERVSRVRDHMPPVMVVGLKSDMEDDRSVGYDEGLEFATRINALKFEEASNYHSVNIEAAFKPLVDIIIQSKTSRRRLSQMRHPDITSMQSLKEVLSFPSTPENSESTVSVNRAVDTKELELDNIEIQIPKFKSNTFAQSAERGNGSNKVSAPNSPKQVSSAKYQPKSKKEVKEFTEEDVEVLEQRVKNHKSQTSCCVIV